MYDKRIMKNLMSLSKKLIFPISLILILSFSRLIPHPWNFSPILAVGIFSGFYFRKFFLASIIVILAMFIGDVFLGFHNTMFFTYISLLAAVALGLLISKFNFLQIIAAGLTSSICFFIITNFGSWLTLEMYEKNLSGLVQSYILAIPFFHNTVLSTLLYLIVIKLLFENAPRKIREELSLFR